MKDSNNRRVLGGASLPWQHMADGRRRARSGAAAGGRTFARLAAAVLAGAAALGAPTALQTAHAAGTESVAASQSRHVRALFYVRMLAIGDQFPPEVFIEFQELYLGWVSLELADGKPLPFALWLFIHGVDGEEFEQMMIWYSWIERWA